ncbi:MAG: SGNH/GDSL hydrolase family protein, partial [Victivallales bacterium]|nr:SGNH/GDSL hydrolase family protein [Victivallales bacterium]
MITELKQNNRYWNNLIPRTRFYTILYIGIMLSLIISKTNANQIADIDKNFRAAEVNNLKVNYRNALNAPFVVEGFPWKKPGIAFFRLPPELTQDDVTGGTLWLARASSGGAIRFRSDSPYITIRAELAHMADMNHMPRAASGGFDLYSGCGRKICYAKTAQPARDQKVLETVLIRDGNKTMRDWTLYLPLYGSAAKIEIGIAPGAQILPPTPHAVLKPIVFYGSSITQGACASRPGNAYTTMLCRAVDAPQINLGFSGNAFGEPAVAKAIATLNPAVVILDYDHNAPSEKHLENTHESFF